MCISSSAGSRPASSRAACSALQPVDAAIASVAQHLDALGAQSQLGRPNMQHALLEWMLLAGSPLLEDLADRTELLAWLRTREINNARRYGVEQLSRTLAEMGVLHTPPFTRQPSREDWLARSHAGELGVPEVWLDWVRRWFRTSTLSSPRSRGDLLHGDQGGPVDRARSASISATRGRGRESTPRAGSRLWISWSSVSSRTLRTPPTCAVTPVAS